MDICDNCPKLMERLGEISEAVERIDKAVNGNGQGGLVQNVDSLRAWRAYVNGALAVLGGLLTGAISVAIAMMSQMVHK